jgi:hypothetical protein
LVFSACQGALNLTQAGTVTDMATAADMATNTTPGTISFADIENDLEKPAFGCTNNAGGCHGGTKPSGVMMLTPNASQDMTALMANYMQIMARVTVATPDQSLLLQKTLQTSTTSHGGIKPFANTQDATYQRWLLWIQLGANFQAVSTTGDM